MFRRLTAALRRRDLAQYAETFDRIHTTAQISAGFARAAATAPLRNIDPKKPQTWEFGGFSQHGEDGIIDYLCSALSEPTRFFFEIGAANGIENCTAWLAFAKSYGGVWVEGNPALCKQARASIATLLWNVHVVESFVGSDTVPILLKMCPHRQPDVFSLDIDSVDYHIALKVLELGFRPKIWVVEYNSVFGPDRKASVPNVPGFDRWSIHPSGLYYGCSIGGWRALFSEYSYDFITVDQTGCNAFFVDPVAFRPGFAEGICGLSFRDNQGDLNGATCKQRDAEGNDFLPSRDWHAQYERISTLPLIEIGSGIAPSVMRAKVPSENLGKSHLPA